MSKSLSLFGRHRKCDWQMRIGRTCLGLPGILVIAAGFGSDAAAQSRKRDVITREEILEVAMRHEDLLQVIRALRPHFLAPPRGSRSMMNGPPAPVQLYVDDTRRSGLDELRMIKPATVEEVRYLEPSKAQDQYGITHNGGAILVTLRRAPG